MQKNDNGEERFAPHFLEGIF